jgi:hypothetical protein
MVLTVVCWKKDIINRPSPIYYSQMGTVRKEIKEMFDSNYYHLIVHPENGPMKSCFDD